MYFFEAQNIYKNYGSFTALKDVSIHVPKGTIYGLLGPNGAGKTTLIRIINQITGPDSGNILFNGTNFKADDVYNIGYLPEERGLYRKMKVGEQALYLAQLKGLSKDKAMESLKYWFRKFEIVDWWDKKIIELSKGMAQKIQFITTILHDPDLLIFDEPLSGFDPVNASLLKSQLLELKEKGKTIILSTHDMASVEELCDNIGLINKAELVLEGKVSEIKQRYKSHKFEIIFTGDKATFEQVLREKNYVMHSFSSEHNRNIAVIEAKNIDGNELLKSVIDKVEIEAYRDILPSMNEVFINVVGGNTNTVQA